LSFGWALLESSIRGEPFCRIEGSKSRDQAYGVHRHVSPILFASLIERILYTKIVVLLMQLLLGTLAPKVRAFWSFIVGVKFSFVYIFLKSLRNSQRFVFFL